MSQKKKAPLSAMTIVVVLAAAAILVTAVVVLLSGQRPAGFSELTTDDFHALAFSPTDKGVVLFGHHNGIMKSLDGGRTWKPLVERQNFDAMALAMLSGDSTIFIAGHNVFYRSTDGGTTWEAVRHDLPGSDIHGFTVSGSDPKRMYAFVVGHGLYMFQDGGSAWKLVSGDLPNDVTSLAWIGADPETLLLGTVSQGVLVSVDGGRSWQSTLVDGAPWKVGVLSVTVGPARKTAAFAGAVDGLYKSEDRGRNWRRLSYPGKNAVSVAVAPDDREVLAIEFVSQGRGIVHRSEDGGDTWDR